MRLQIKETAHELMMLEKRNPLVGKRLRFIRSLKAAPYTNVESEIRNNGLSVEDATQWLQLYMIGGVELLMNARIKDPSVTGMPLLYSMLSRYVPREQLNQSYASLTSGSGALVGQGGEYIPKIDRLPTSGYQIKEGAYNQAYKILHHFVNSQNCRDAFKSVRIDLVDLLHNKGIRLGPSDFLQTATDRKWVQERLGLTNEGLKLVYGSKMSGGTAYTIRREYLVEKSLPTIFLSGRAVIKGNLHLAYVLAHELFHAAGRKGNGKGAGGLFSGFYPGDTGHDLDDIKEYDDILTTCGWVYR